MYDICLDYFSKNYPQLTFYVVVFGIVLFIGWYIRVMYTSILDLVKKINSFDGQIKDLSNNVDTKLNSFSVDINNKISAISTKMDNNIGLITKDLENLNKTLVSVTTVISTELNVSPDIFRVNSPRELTELGEKILTDIKGKKYVDSNLDSLISEIKETNPKTGLDVEMNISTILYFRSSNDEFNELKQYLFNNPEYKNGEKTIPLNINLAISLMMIYTRNKYFEIYPDLKKDL